ncbi:unnamed protein product [Nezara viridula]|uniref:Uncharacterized protein n=1 Tax=Nezara viridula TaxID=85310 RepID=A0A9P0H3L0_NEZVI|nr:unnamed protein product [Nezara viridula]
MTHEGDGYGLQRGVPDTAGRRHHHQQPRTGTGSCGHHGLLHPQQAGLPLLRQDPRPQHRDLGFHSGATTAPNVNDSFLNRCHVLDHCQNTLYLT